LTLPGSFHAGFSTGLNVGEAVNFASKSWIKHGVLAQTIYRKTREKIPVFPFEWILIQNIIHMDKVKLNKATLKQISESFRVWLNTEKTNRKKIEASFLALYNDLDQNSAQVWTLM
jgi:hypothetical protein